MDADSADSAIFFSFFMPLILLRRCYYYLVTLVTCGNPYDPYCLPAFVVLFFNQYMHCSSSVYRVLPLGCVTIHGKPSHPFPYIRDSVGYVQVFTIMSRIVTLFNWSKIHPVHVSEMDGHKISQYHIYHVQIFKI